MSNFREQLANGNKYELRSLMYLEHDSYEQKKGLFKPYDLLITKDGVVTKIEVKSDTQASRTKNLAIEYRCNNKPSGIYSTEAKYYMYFIIYPKDIQADGIPREECYKIPVNELKVIAKKGFRVKGGDGKRSCMYMVNKSLVKKYLINKIVNYNNVYNINPKMSDQEAKTSEVKPLSYSQKLIQAFLDRAEKSNKETYGLVEIEELINEFSKLEYEKRQQKTSEMPFGKYKFRKISDVGAFDSQYLRWIVKQDCLKAYQGVRENISTYLLNVK